MRINLDEPEVTVETNQHSFGEFDLVYFQLNEVCFVNKPGKFNSSAFGKRVKLKCRMCTVVFCYCVRKTGIRVFPVTTANSCT